MCAYFLQATNAGVAEDGVEGFLYLDSSFTYRGGVPPKAQQGMTDLLQVLKFPKH